MFAVDATDERYRLEQKFDDCGRRWAAMMLQRLQARLLDVPLVWPGTAEQALTIVHALADESLGDGDRANLADVVQNGARAAWRDLLVRV